MKRMIILISIVFLIVIGIWWRAPIFFNNWDKQTIYVGLLDTWYGSSKDNKAYAMWIDDDSTPGVFNVKMIADDVGISPCFAVIAGRMEPVVADSLASWQKKGAGIVLHGLRHERWKEWSASQIESDIHQSYEKLNEQGFDTFKILRLIIPPHGCNTRTIRKAIAQQGFKMISGATLVNPDRHVFQYGRISIAPNTDLNKIREMLQVAYKKNAFVIFSTHSSIPHCFSIEKTKEVMQMAKEIGFCFDINEIREATCQPLQ